MPQTRPPLLLRRPDRPLVVSYAHWWRLPPPLPPRRLPLVRLGVVLAVVVVALVGASLP
jgi:hypothetical protein